MPTLHTARPRLPETHTLPAAELRRLNLLIESLAFLVDRTPCSLGLRQTITGVVGAWEPLRAECERQHVEWQEGR